MSALIKNGFVFSFIVMLSACTTMDKKLDMEVFETSASGNKIQRLTEFPAGDKTVAVKILPDEKFQTITGFGGSFTESSASLLNKLSKENRDKILEAYFGEAGARYSLTRTHINSCDFSLSQYSYRISANTSGLAHSGLVLKIRIKK